MKKITFGLGKVMVGGHIDKTKNAIEIRRIKNGHAIIGQSMSAATVEQSVKILEMHFKNINGLDALLEKLTELRNKMLIK